MPKKYKIRLALAVVLTGLSPAIYAGSIRNIILCIGDGMGPEQVYATTLYTGTNLFFESFPYQSIMTTHSANNPITDSAASSTAMATGVKVNNTVISLNIPGDGSELETLVEYYKARGKSTGLVTTAFMTHATPGAFGAHTDARHHFTQIADDYLTETQPNILFGGGGNGLTPGNASAAGYSVVTNKAQLLALDTGIETMVSGQFGDSHMPYEIDGLGDLPHLHEMTMVALNILDNDPDGFFLMVEGAKIDRASHLNDIIKVVHETIEFADTVQLITEWMGDREDTLIIVTADHETCGLTVITDNGAGNYPDVAWTAGWHTSTPVPVYAIGVNAYHATNVTDNTHINTFAKSAALMPENLVAMQVGASTVETTWTSSSGDVYSVEQSMNLLSNDWQSISVHTAETFRLTIATTNLPPSDQAFFRLITLGTTSP